MISTRTDVDSHGTIFKVHPVYRLELVLHCWFPIPCRVHPFSPVIRNVEIILENQLAQLGGC